MVPLPCLAACGSQATKAQAAFTPQDPGPRLQPKSTTHMRQKCDNPLLALVPRKASQGSFRVRWEGPHQLRGTEDPGPLWGSS